MLSKELEILFKTNNWNAYEFGSHDNYDPPEKILYALVASLEDISMIDPNQHPWWISTFAERKAKADDRYLHQFDVAHRNKSIVQLLKEYATKGKKVKARVELKARVPFASFLEQKRILCAFLEGISVDRLFALRYLEKHWDNYYASFVEKVWRAFHEMESARVITHHFPMGFIEANQSALIEDYLYLQVRLRLPASAPIDRSKLSISSYLYLCARLSLPISDLEAEKLFYQGILDVIAKCNLMEPFTQSNESSDEKQGNLYDISTISSMVWSLGRLGKTYILLRFVDFEKEIYSLVINEKWTEVKNMFLKLRKPLDFSRFEKILAEREKQKKNSDSTFVPFDVNAYIDERVEEERDYLNLSGMNVDDSLSPF